MTTAEAAEARFRWLCHPAERLGCKLYVGDYGTSQGWDGKTGLTRSGERVVAVNMNARVSFAAASIHEQVGAEAGIDMETCRWFAASWILLHELGHALLAHGPDRCELAQAETEANAFAWRAAEALSKTHEMTEEEATEALTRIGAELTRDRAPARAH